MKEGKKMENYIKKLIENKSNCGEAEKEAIRHCKNLPKLKQYNTLLSEMEETIVKAVYLVGGMFISDIQMMLTFSTENQTVERTIKTLIEDGYMQKVKTPYGYLVGLTKEGVKQIKAHPDYLPAGLMPNVQEMDITGESAYLKRKCISFAAAEYVFTSLLQQLWCKFWNSDKLERNYYLCKQFLKNITYRNFLAMSPEEQTLFLSDAGLADEEQSLFIGQKKYIIWNATQFANLLFIKKGFDNIKAEPQYHDYFQIIKELALKKPNTNTFYLLKDFISQNEVSSYQELHLLWKWKSTLPKFGMDKFRTEITGNIDLILKEKKLDSCNRILSVLQNERRSLTNKNAYKNKCDEKGLGEIVVRLAELDYSIEGIRKEKEELETDFSFAVLKSYDGAENDYEEKVITLQRLSQNGIFLTAVSDKEITLSLVQVNEEVFDLFTLHRKLAMALQLIKRLSAYASVQINIYTFSQDQQEFIERILPMLKKKLLESKETAFFGNQLDEICTIHKASESLKGRYIFYQMVIEKMKGGFSDEEERAYGTAEDGSN